MKIKSILLFSCAIITLNIYSQEYKIQKENILIISELTNDYSQNIENVFKNDFGYQKEYFNYSKIRLETIISPDKNVSCIIEIPIEYKMKFGKLEATELTDFEIRFFYNENGFLYKIIQESGIPTYQFAGKENKVSESITELNIGKFGELIQKQNSYETNSNGITKIINYNENGDVVKRYEIFYNDKGQIIKYDTFTRNNLQKEYTKSFDYDVSGNLTKSLLVENYENEIKIIPRKSVTLNYFNNSVVSKFSSNDFAEGTNSISDFSKIGGVTLNDFINKKKLKITISDKSILEIKKGILQKWRNSNFEYECIFNSEPKINSWEEKKIYIKLYNQTKEKEHIASIKRKYVTIDELEKENNLTEARKKINVFIDEVESNEILKKQENSMKFTLLNVDIENFPDWFRYDGEYSRNEENNYANKIIDFYKINSDDLVQKYKEKLNNKALNLKELNLIFKEISNEFQNIINQTIEKIKNRRAIVDSLLKDKSIFQLYKNPKISGSPTFATNSKEPYEGFKKEDLYYAYKKLYKTMILEIDENINNELQKIQDKLIYLEPLNTKKLEKFLRNEKNETEITKSIINFQVE